MTHRFASALFALALLSPSIALGQGAPTVITPGNAGIVVSPNPGVGPVSISLGNPSASTLGGIESIVVASHSYLDSISTGGVPHASRPNCADLSDSSAICSLGIGTGLSSGGGNLNLANIAGGTVLGNPTTSSAAPTATATPTLGVPGTSSGSLALASSSGGTTTVSPPASASSFAIALPSQSGTVPVTAQSPLVLSTPNGNLSCNTCLTGITLSGDVTGTGGATIATTVVRVNGVSYPASPASVNTVPVVTSTAGGGVVTYETVPAAALPVATTSVVGVSRPDDAGIGVSAGGVESLYSNSFNSPLLTTVAPTNRLISSDNLANATYWTATNVVVTGTGGISSGNTLTTATNAVETVTSATFSLGGTIRDLEFYAQSGNTVQWVEVTITNVTTSASLSAWFDVQNCLPGNTTQTGAITTNTTNSTRSTGPFGCVLQMNGRFTNNGTASVTYAIVSSNGGTTWTGAAGQVFNFLAADLFIFNAQVPSLPYQPHVQTFTTSYAAAQSAAANTSATVFGYLNAGGYSMLPFDAQDAGGILFSPQGPTVASGFCTSPAIVSNGTAAFQLTVGSACAGSIGTLSMPIAPHGWSCHAEDTTSSSTLVVGQTGFSTSSANFASYSRTTGMATNWTASDVILFTCTGF